MDFSQPLVPVIDRDNQVLRFLAAHRESGRLGFPSDDAVAAGTGLTLDQVRAAARSLSDEGVVQARRSAGNRWHFERLAPGVNVRTGLWPTPDDGATRLLAALEEAITRESNPDRRSLLVKIRDVAVADGRALAVTLAGAALGPALGLGG